MIDKHEDNDLDYGFYEDDLLLAERAGDAWFSFEDWKAKRDAWEEDYHKLLQANLKQDKEEIEW